MISYSRRAQRGYLVGILSQAVLRDDAARVGHLKPGVVLDVVGALEHTIL